MMLREAIEQYILWRQAHGAKFTSNAGILRRFLKYADGNIGCDAVTKTQVLGDRSRACTISGTASRFTA